ncbi:MAG TPA: TetR/AcrR family transcriptional regulator [Stellaceae bacterium]|jgi:AcrR family transcriptional regulator|nr:TetR/AcrR family transcriptional regulator [Stellaceae bacterium]
MAKRSKARSAKTATTAGTPRDRILDATLALAEREGWRKASLGAIAGEAGMPLRQLYGEFRSRAAILSGLMARTDAGVLTETPAAEADESPRDRLFDVLMRRFDALKAQRAALKVIARELGSDPPTALCSAPAFLRSMTWMLEAAGLSSAGIRGRFRVRVLAVLYLCVLRVFVGDNSEDLAKTMAALDRRLRQAEPWLGLGGFRWGPESQKENA